MNAQKCIHCYNLFLVQNETEVDEIVARSSRRRHQVVARTIVSEQVRARIRRIRHIVDSEDESDVSIVACRICFLCNLY